VTAYRSGDLTWFHQWRFCIASVRIKFSCFGCRSIVEALSTAVNPLAIKDSRIRKSVKTNLKKG